MCKRSALTIAWVLMVVTQTWSADRPYMRVFDHPGEDWQKARMEHVHDEQQSTEFLRSLSRDWKNVGMFRATSSVITDEGAAAIAIARVGDLTLNRVIISRAGMDAICKTPRLYRFYLHNLPLQPGDLRGLKAANLLYLSIFNTPFDDDDMHSLAQMKGLVDLALVKVQISGPGLTNLKDMKRLEKLSMGKFPIDDQGIAHLPLFPKLRVMDLKETSIGDEGFLKLPIPDTLEVLDVVDTKVTEDAARRLAQRHDGLSIDGGTTPTRWFHKYKNGVRVVPKIRGDIP